MALIQCQECHERISDLAQTCPHCGAPLIATVKQQRKATLIELGIHLAIVMIIVIAAWLLLHKLNNQYFTPIRPPPQSQAH